MRPFFTPHTLIKIAFIKMYSYFDIIKYKQMKTRTLVSFVILLSLLTIQSNFSQWQQTAMTTGNISSLAATQTHIFAANQTVYSSTDNGTSWTQTGMNAHMLGASGNNLFSIAWSQFYVFRSVNNGVNWTQHQGGAADGIYCIAVNGNNVFSGLIHYGLRISTNNGDNWSSAPGLNGSIYSIAANGNFVFAERQGILYRSTNLGNNWSQTPLPVNSINAIVTNGSIVYAGTDNNGVYISTDNGVTWNQTSLNNQTIKSLAVTGSNVFAGTTTGGVYYSNNNGTSWVQKNEGLTNLSADALLINGNYIYLGTGGAGVWKRPLSELLSVNVISTEVPKAYSLYQNYPNPFNPTTNIKFSLPASGFTILSVYDAGGRLVNTLVNENLNAGTYEADFHASGLSSGIYFYTLSSGDFIKTNKMILVK